MNTSKPATGTQRLMSEVQLARLRLARAESSLDSAKEQAREVKQAKADLQESKQVLQAAEAKLDLARKRAALAKKQAKALKAVKATVAKSGETKKEAAPRRSQPEPEPVGPVAAAQPAEPGANPPPAIPRDIETPPVKSTSLPEIPAPIAGTAN